MEITLRKERETTELGAKIARVLEPGDLVVLAGDLGAGKTFLAGAIIHALGLAEDAPVTSPTFTLVQEYETPRGRVLHVDLYRLRGQQEGGGGAARSAAEREGGGGAARSAAQQEGEERGKTVKEIVRLGMAEARAEGAILLVEWGDGFEHELGGEAAVHADIRIEQSLRKVSIRGPKTPSTL